MRKAASIAWTLATGLLVTVAGLALKLDLLIILTLALFAAGCVFYLVDYRTRRDRRVYLNLTTKQIRSVYENRTTAQGEKAASIYIGKWMRVAGTVHDVDLRGVSGPILHLEGDSPSIRFSRRKARQLEVLHKGELVEVEGQVWAITPNWVGLKNGELISTAAPSTEPQA